MVDIEDDFAVLTDLCADVGSDVGIKK